MCRWSLAFGVICLCWLLAASAWGQESSVTDSGVGGTKAPGTVGGPCLDNGTCVAGARCYKQGQEGENICLFPGNAGSNVGQSCPSTKWFLRCDPGGVNCEIVCVEVRGFGCSLDDPAGRTGWGMLLAMALFFGLGWRARWRRQKRRDD